MYFAVSISVIMTCDIAVRSIHKLSPNLTFTSQLNALEMFTVSVFNLFFSNKKILFTVDLT